MLKKKGKSSRRILLLAIFASVVLSTTVIGFSVFGPAEEAHAAGTGTAADPIEIGTAAELLAMGQSLTSGPNIMKCYKLTKDIDLSGYGSWAPMGSVNWPYMGTFDGDGHKITTLYINTPNADNVGLFGFLQGATITNLGLEGVNITGRNNVGAIAGKIVANATPTTISYSYVTGSVNGTGSVGGITGVAENVNITSCYVKGSVNGTGNVGGIVGYIFPGTIKNCYTTCSVTGAGNNVGGIAGMENANDPAHIEAVYASGTVNGRNYTGGLVGGMGTGSSTKNSVAINPKVSGTDVSIYVPGRITGMKNGTLSNNYAFDKMEGRDTNFSFTNKTHDGNSGADTSIKNVLSAAWWNDKSNWTGTTGWDVSVWEIRDGKLPILKNVGGPQDGKLPDELLEDIGSATVTVDKTHTYTGLVINPTRLVVTFDGSTLTHNKDYTWELTSTDGTGTSAGKIVGTVTVTIKGMGLYTGTVTAKYEITKATLKVEAKSMSRVYGASNPALTADVTGFVNGETIANISGSYSLSTTATVSSGVGPYPITINSSLSSRNYDIVIVNGTLTVTAAGIDTGKITATVNGTFTYKGIAQKPLADELTVKDGSTTLIPDEDYEIYSYGTNINVGQASVTIKGKGNYSGTLTVNFTIGRASLTVTAEDKSRAYGAANPPWTVKIDGLENGETAANVITGSFLFNVPAVQTSAAGTYTITVSIGTASAANYEFKTFASGTLTVTKVDIATSGMTGTVNGTFTYTGREHTPPASAMTVTDGKNTLSPGTDYIVLTATYKNNINAGTASVDIEGHGNYTGTLTLEFQIGKAPLTVTAGNASKVFNTENPAFSATVSGFVNSETEAGVFDSITYSYQTSAVKSSPVGPYFIKPEVASSTFKDKENYEFITFVNGTLTITRAGIGESNISAVVNGTLTYTGVAQSPSSANVIVTDDADNGKLLTLGKDYEITSSSNNVNVGTATLNIRGIGNYSGTTTATFKIVKATVTVTVKDTSRPYNTANPTTYVVTYSGFVPGEDHSVIKGAFSFSTTATASSPVGAEKYPITAADGTATADNYEFDYVDGWLTITQMDLGALTDITITVDSVHIYNGDEHKPTLIVKDLGKDLFEGTDKDYTVSCGNNINAGVNTASVKLTGVGNYMGTRTVYFTINKAELTVTADDKNRPYNTPEPQFTATVTGFVSGENEAVIKGAFSFSTDAGRLDKPKKYTITVVRGTATADNYDFKFEPGELEVTAVDMGSGRISASISGTFTYTGVDQKPPVTVTDNGAPLILDEHYTVTYTNNKDAGTATATIDGIGDYYTGSTVIHFTINKAPLIVIADDNTKVFNTENPTLTVTIDASGFVNGENDTVLTSTFSVSTTATDTSNVGDYLITAGIDSAGEDNYRFIFRSGTLKITPLKIALPVPVDPPTDNEFEYGGEKIFKINYDLANVDIIGVTTATNLGSYRASAVLKDKVNTVWDDTNETTDDITFRWYILSADSLNISVDGVTVPYDGESHKIIIGAGFDEETDELFYLVGGEFVKEHPVCVNADTYTIQYRIERKVDGNLVGAQEGSALIIINKVELTVTMESTERYYNTANPKFKTEEITGLVGNDKIIGEFDFSTSAVKTSPRGDYIVFVSKGSAYVGKDGTSDESNNYTFKFVSGILKVTVMDIYQSGDVKATVGGPFTYNGFEQTPPVIVTDDDEILKVGTDYTISYESNKNVGQASVTIKGIGNYSGTITINFDITKAPLKLTADNASRAYNTGDPAFSAQVSGFVGNETSSVISLSYTFTTNATISSTVGSSYYIRPVITSFSAVDGNYEITTVDGTLTITRAGMGSGSISATVNGTLTYTGVAQSPTSANVIVTDNGKPLTLNVDYEITSSSNNVNAGTATLNIRGINNYNGTTTATFEIVKATVKVTVTDTSRPYNTPNPTTYAVTYSGFVNGEDQSVIKGAFSFSTTATATSPAGLPKYPITAEDGTATADNYEFDYVDGWLTITGMDIGATYDIEANVDGPLVYKAAAYEPVPTVTDAGTVLKLNTDFKIVSYFNNTNAGVNTASVTIEGMNNYSGTRTIYFTIEKAPLKVIAEDKTKEFNTPDPPFTVKLEWLVDGETQSDAISGAFSFDTTATSDPKIFTITVAAGTASADNYFFDEFVSGELEITEKNIGTSKDISASVEGTYTYNGEKHEPDGDEVVVITDKGVRLVEGNDYDIISYGVNINAGPASVTIKGKGNYSGELTIPFTIKKVLLEVTADDKERVYYTSVEFTAEVKGFVPGESITFPDGSFLFASAGPTDPPRTYAIEVSLGTATALNYDFVFKNGTLTVTRSDIGESKDISGSAGGPYVYKGSAHEPLPVVTDKETWGPGPRKTLVLDVDYRIIEYKNNINAGTASVIIEGINNYVGTLEITFVIEKATLTVTADDTERQFKMGNPPLTETVEGFQGTDTGSLIIGTFLLETTADASSPAGGYVISVEKGTADAGNNYKFVFVNGTLTVTPMDIGTPDEIMATVNGTFTYTGLPHKPSVTVTDDWKIRTLLTQGKDYELSYSNNTNAGTATVTITGIGNYAGTLTVNFTINKAVLIVTADDKRKAPGADDPKFTATAKGFVNNENSSVIKGQFLIWRDGDDPTLGEAPDENGIYSRFTIWISTGTASADNYEFKFMNGTLTIRDKDSLIPTWMPIAAVAAVVLILLFMLTGVRFRETGSVTHNGRGLAGVVIEYTMNGESGTAVTDRNGQYLIRALAGSEVTIMNAEKKGYELSGTLPEPFIMEKATNVDLTMEKV